MSIGTNIRYLCRQKKVTQEQLAERLAVSRRIVSKWETDEATPELAKLTALCDEFSCSLDSLRAA